MKEEENGLSLCKKVKKSILLYGFTFGTTGSPYLKLFEGNKKLKPNEYRDVTLVWEGKEYPAKLGSTGDRFWKGKFYSNAYRILYSRGKDELKQKLAKTFISSYIRVMSGQNITESNAKEVIKITPLSNNKILLEPFLVEKTNYDELFRKFIEKDVFGWISHNEEDSMFLKSHGWSPKKDLKKHFNENFVIYYLIDSISKPKKLYIGSARNLGSRFRAPRNEIPNWDSFRYDVLKPEFSGLLRRFEFHTILAFSSIFKNTMNYPTLGLEEFIVVNRARGLNP